jgi:hypothetical protein
MDLLRRWLAFWRDSTVDDRFCNNRGRGRSWELEGRLGFSAFGALGFRLRMAGHPKKLFGLSNGASGPFGAEKAAATRVGSLAA